MDKESILTKSPKLKYVELAEDVKKDEFIKIVESRRSVRVFTEEKIKEKDFIKCLDLALLAPNSSNLQVWEFYWVKTASLKEKLREYCLNQSAARTAQELVVCVARPDKWKKNNALLQKAYQEREEDTPEIVKKYYKKIVPIVYSQGPFGFFGLLKRLVIFLIGIKRPIPREPVSNCDMRVWAQKTTALACENLMLALRSFGYDSCPMEGMDSKKIKKMLKLPRRSEICMVIGAGKRAKYGVYDKRIRLGTEDIIKIV